MDLRFRDEQSWTSAALSAHDIETVGCGKNDLLAVERPRGAHRLPARSGLDQRSRGSTERRRLVDHAGAYRDSTRQRLPTGLEDEARAIGRPLGPSVPLREPL